MLARRFTLLCLLGFLSTLTAGACSSSSTNQATAGTGGTGATDGGGTGGTDAGKACAGNVDCDDGNSCNGGETCSDGHCVSGTAAADGTACTPAGVDAGADHKCDKGECRLVCDQDADCDDGDVCTGTETCSPSKTCQSGTALDCDDGSPCTEDECDPEAGCHNPLIDKDGDGYASTELGACGTDCNDNDAAIHPGAPDPCNDSVDSNCNGITNDNELTWYADCDDDGFAPADPQTAKGCTPPEFAPTCTTGTGTWTGKTPAAGTTDCADNAPKAYPRTSTENLSAWSSTAIVGATTAVDYDYNCDGTEEKRWTTKGVSKTASCGWLTYPNGLKACTGSAGWTGSLVPDCGLTAEYTKCSISAGYCLRTTNSIKQECR